MTEYRGRFAPTPSGPLHFGSLFAAVVSYLDAKANNGKWLLRIEDLDPPREQPGATSAILQALEQHGLEWDDTETYQSQHHARYANFLHQLEIKGRLFWCTCSRKQLSGHAIYPGNCRHHNEPRANSAARLHVEAEFDSFIDVFQEEQSANPKADYGDVVLQRKEKLFAYQLAVVADDIDQGINHVIRGIDLLESTYWQRELYRALAVASPTYGHFAVLHPMGSNQKLSKQNLAPAVNLSTIQTNLWRIFKLLDLAVELAKPEQMLEQGIQQWQRQCLVQKQILHVPVYTLD